MKLLLFSILLSFSGASAFAEGIVSLDLKNIANINHQETPEVVYRVECIHFHRSTGGTWEAGGIDIHQEACPQVVTQKRPKIKYQQRVWYKKTESIVVTLKDGQEIVSPEVEDRRTNDMSSRQNHYENAHLKVVAKMKEMVADANTTYFNQYNLCYQNGASVPSDGNLFQVKTERVFKDCDSIDPDSMIFKKD